MDLRPFERHTFRVEALQVTKANIHEVAAWCGAQIKKPDNGAPYLIVPSGTRGNTAKARIGDWITRLTSANNYRVYQNHVFREYFRELPAEPETVTQVAHEVAQAMSIQAYSGGDINRIAIEAAKKILSLV